MDPLEKLEAEKERVRDFWEARRNPKPKEAPKLVTHPITILGCIKTETGWYRLGFDEQAKIMKPLEFLGKD